MHNGQRVRYYNGEQKKERRATVLAIVGAGSSNYKKLNLLVGKQTIEDIPHQNDAEPGASFWLLVGEKLVVPEEEGSTGG